MGILTSKSPVNTAITTTNGKKIRHEAATYDSAFASVTNHTIRNAHHRHKHN
jgi:hypothetical protein